MAHLNIRSLKNKIEEVHQILCSHPIDVLTLSETWLTPHTEDTILAVNGFNLYRCDRSKGPLSYTSKGGGLLIYTSTKCTVDTTTYQSLNISNPHIETQTIIAKRLGDRSTVIVNTYRPPSGDPTLAQSHLENVLHRISSERFADIYVLGDINLDHSRSKRTTPTKNLIHMFNVHGLSQKITSPTRISKTTKSIIDVVYVKSDKIISPFILPLALSDHYLVGCSRHLSYRKDPKSEFYGRSYRHYTFDEAEAYYTSLDKSLIYHCNDVNLVWKILYQFILNCANKLCPVKKITTRPHQPPWISKEVLELLSDRDLLFRDAS